MTRREWSKLILAGLAGLAMPGFLSPGGVIGLQTYSLRDRSLDEAIKAMVQLGIKSCELWEGHVEPLELQWKRNSTPPEMQRKKELLTEWRNGLQMSYIGGIKEKLNEAGIKVQAYNATIKDNISEHDLELAFKIAHRIVLNVGQKGFQHI